MHRFCLGGCRSRWKRHSVSRHWRMLWLVTESRKFSTRTRARSSPACSPATASPSAWTAKGLGGTMSSSSGCGAASSTRRCICGLILQIEDRTVNPTPRESDGRTYKAVIKYDGAEFFAVDIKTQGSWHWGGWAKHEIIGNIYEHPDPIK